jgi:small subunit ribosomal protein S4
VTKRNNRKFGISRRLGVNLWGNPKDPVATKNFPPGQHGSLGYKKLTDHGTQLQAKQKLKKYYGDIRESQFRAIYDEAVRRKGDTSENLIGLLESRLDAIIYRSKFAPTIFTARQMVNHKHVLVDGKVVNIASYRVKPGQIIEIKEKSRERIQSAMKEHPCNERPVPEYIEVNENKMTAKYNRIPQLNDVPYPVTMEPNVVIEFYSKN